MTIPIVGTTDISVGVTLSAAGAYIPAKWTEAAFTCRVTTQHGTWLNLDDHERYIVAADSFGDTTTQMRRQNIQSPYVAGQFTVSAIPDQVQQGISVYVLGASQSELQINLKDLIDAFTQPAFQLVWSLDEASFTWDCEAADYTISFTNTGFFARTVNVKFQVPRHPQTMIGSLT